MRLKAKQGLIKFKRKRTGYVQSIIEKSSGSKYKLFFDVDGNGLIDYGERAIGELQLSPKWTKKVNKNGLKAIRGEFKQTDDPDVFFSKKIGTISFDDPIMYGGLDAFNAHLEDTVEWANDEITRIQDDAENIDTTNEMLDFVEEVLDVTEPNNPIADKIGDMIDDMQDKMGIIGDLPLQSYYQ